MEVAVAQVAEHDEARIRKCPRERPVAFGQEFGNCGDRQRNVVLDIGAFPTLRFADVLAQLPQFLCLVDRLRDHGIERNVIAHGGGQRGFRHGRQRCVGGTVVGLDQNKPWVARQRMR